MIDHNKTKEQLIRELEQLREEYRFQMAMLEKDKASDQLEKNLIQAEESLQISEERFTGIFNNLQDVFFQADLAGNFILVSPSATRLYGYHTVEEMIGMPAVNLYADQETRELLLQELSTRGSIEDFVCQGRKKDGSTFWVSMNVQFRFQKGKKIGTEGIVRDITERKRAEVALIESEARFKTIFMKSPIGIVVSDSITGEIRQVNSRFAEIVGRSVEELTSIDWMRITHPDDVQPNQEKVLQMQEGQISSIEMEKRYLRPNGTIVWISMTLVPLEGFQNDHPHNLCMVEDITDKRQNELELILSRERIEQSEYRLKLATASGRLGIWDWNIQNDEQIWDQRMYELYGINGNDFSLIKDPWVNGIHPDDQEQAIKECNAALAGEHDYNTSFRVLHSDGKVLYLKADGFVIRDMDGKPLRMIGINRDITDAKLAEEELIKAKEKAEESDRLKTTFLANMSHEIRTPLNSIIGFSELLKEPDSAPEHKDGFVDMIIESGNNLLVIMNDILDLSMLESGQMHLIKNPFPLKKLFSDLEKGFKSKAHAKGLDFRVKVPDDIEDREIVNDFYRIKQVCNNLIGNALKFTSDGFIEIGFLDFGHGFEFYVKDTGIGISSEYHNDIFMRFRQVDETKTRKYGGNGLGLSISKSLVEMLGGKIWVESEVDKGSLFRFFLPK